MAMSGSIIGPYRQLPAECLPYDGAAPVVAERVAARITGGLDGVFVEHFGSTAVPGCQGKGVVDLMLIYAEGKLQAAIDRLETLGFQKQSTRDPFPEDRPMRIGSIVHEDRTFLLHVHVICSASPEIDGLRRFRDRLRTDSDLRAAYIARKQKIIAMGITDSVDYSQHKSDFIVGAIANRAS